MSVALVSMHPNTVIDRARSTITVAPGQSIQTAIDAARPGDTIMLQAGLYTESFTIDKSINVVGAGMDAVIIHPYPYQRVVTITGPVSATAPLLQGFTIECGLATDAGDQYIRPGCQHVHTGPAPGELSAEEQGQYCSRITGGGICAMPFVNVRLDAMRMISNLAEVKQFDLLTSGGGIRLSGGGALTVTNSEFRANRSAYTGAILGSANSVYISGSTFISNSAYAGGPGAIAAGPLTLINNTLIGNGNRAVTVAGPGVIRGNRFIQNWAQCDGAAIAAASYGGQLEISNNVFVSNTNLATRFGYQCGEIWFEDFTTYGKRRFDGAVRLVLSANTFMGGPFQAIFVLGSQSSTLQVQNSIFVGYAHPIIRTPPTEENVPSVLVDRVLSKDAAQLVWTFEATRTNQYAVPAVSNITVTNSISLDPLLAPDGYHLLPDSPAIDAGAPGAPSTDIDGQYRPQRGAPDIGADEFYDAVPLSDFTLNCPPASAGLSLLGAQTSPPNLSRPVTYTLNAPGEPARTFTGWTSDTLGVPWTAPGAKTVTVTAANPLGSVTRSCAVAVSAAARVFWMPVVGR
jgi:hypothetical protein